jgi:hypothetical protein
MAVIEYLYGALVDRRYRLVELAGFAEKGMSCVQVWAGLLN